MTIIFETIEHRTGIEEIAVIYNEDGSYTSMPKAVYDAQVEHLTEIPPQAALSTPNV